ncbi:hypothetical protein F8154_05740 [Alkaliphilus pronyensis]|uniref:Sporulation protein YunB n=1 Tax=Alkaliphilus pronyensis TaxID=1482732 RepID=A0A6I0F2U3_9FIRM|nr:hypothetical protein [Alkaliphilus pronyensis]KAB3535632.1 hypothetical protein F8154_05740 [Alkaliphilus pronyensis]
MNSNFWMILFIATIIIFSFAFSWIIVVEVISIHSLNLRVENSLIASGWAGFSQLDLATMGERIDLLDSEGRDIYLDKTKAIQVVRDYIKANLNLDDDLVATGSSYIHHRQQPVVIEEITIYNPHDLPAVTSDNIPLKRTTIHIIILVPKDIKFLGTTYLKKSVPVDIKAFM